MDQHGVLRRALKDTRVDIVHLGHDAHVIRLNLDEKNILIEIASAKADQIEYQIQFDSEKIERTMMTHAATAQRLQAELATVRHCRVQLEHDFQMAKALEEIASLKRKLEYIEF
jgi:hypothetical protein